MKKAYIQPEIEVLSVASLENFLTASFDESASNLPEGKQDYKDPWA